MRNVLVTVLVGLAPGVALGKETSPWLDPGNGCGRGSAFAQSGKAADLPGCTGKLPKDAPKVEQVLHDAKRALVDAEEALAKGRLEKVDELVAAAEKGLAVAPPFHPELPDRWEQAQPLYQRAVASLKNGRRLAPHLEKLRSSWAAAVEAGRTRNKLDVEGGPAETVKLADACVAALRDAKGDGVDLSTEVALDKDARKPLDAARAECEKVRKSAEPLVKQQEKAAARAKKLAAKRAAKAKPARKTAK